MSSTLDATLRRINRQTEEQAAEQLAVRYELPYAQLDDYPFNLEALSAMSIDDIQKKQYAIYVRTPGKIRVAIAHPEDQLLVDEITLLGRTWGVEIELTVVSPSSIQAILMTYARLIKEEADSKEQAIAAVKKQDENNYFKKIRTIADLEREIAHASVTEVLEALIAAAYNQGASDIHLEPTPDSLTVRFRIDGVLQKIISVPIKYHAQLVSRIRVMGNIKLDPHAASQDGRFSMGDKGINADFRVSIVPTGYGPGVVMRILRQDMEALSLADLGFSEYNRKLIESKIHRPYGLIVVTGPTGSGKSTTLYSILNELNSTEKKILTLEDPIEYRLEGIQQSQINADQGYTFAEGLKGALRQDPDIVMVGEIRDPETATIALNASLTGHLVLSTLHTNDAVTAHARFLELGVAPFLLTGSVQMIIAQRLVRKIVPGSDPANPEYKGRLIIGEVLCPSPDFEQAVLKHSDPTTLNNLARAGGMIPMVEDGLAKVKEGVTTEQEVYRVTAA